MSFRATAFSLLAASLASGAFACASDDPLDSDEDALSAEDTSLARTAISILRGEKGKCIKCHTAEVADISRWGKAMADIDRTCFAGEASARARVACLSAGGLTPRKLGLYAAFGSSKQMRALYDEAFGSEGAAAHGKAFAAVTMPMGGAGLSETELATLKTWVLRGMPGLEEAARGGQNGAPATCRPHVSDELKAHVRRMQSEGWSARLAERATPMFGCGEATDPLACFATAATIPLGVSGSNARFVKLVDRPDLSHFWIRSSADGRWVSFGAFEGDSKIVDLSQPTPSAALSVRAAYDPFFLPSNDGFGFAKSHRDGQIRVCKQTLLADAAKSWSKSISLTEDRCAKLGTESEYQSLGTALDGARYFMTLSEHRNDDGGRTVTRPLGAGFSADATIDFVPMVNDGLAYRASAPVSVAAPAEGDAILSPSTLVVATRFQSQDGYQGYRLRSVQATNANGSVKVTAPIVGELCMGGSKVSFSFDERFVVTHRYVDTRAPDQAGLPDESANIELVDLMTGARVRLTNMGARQYALYPHFRADGWLYFLVRDMTKHTEYVVATDAALRIARGR